MFSLELWLKSVDNLGVVLYSNQWLVNFILHFAELHIGSSIRDKNILFGNYFLKCNKVSKGAKIRNRYNQVPHLTQDTNGKVTHSQETPQTRANMSALSQQVTKAHINRRAQRHSKHKIEQNIKDPQKKYALERSVKYFTGGLNPV